MFHPSRKIGRAAFGALLITALIFTVVFAQGITIDPSVNTFTLHEGEVYPAAPPEILTVTVPAEAAVKKADIYFLADTTGSMMSAINAVRSGASTLLSDLAVALSDTDLAFGVGNYKDFPHDAYAFDHQVSLTTTTADVLTGINAWSASGGNDGSEGQFFALDRIADDADPAGGTIGWRPDAEKIVVWFGDWPAHDPVCGAISGLPYDITEASLTTKLVDAKVAVIAISTTTGLADGLDGNPQLSAFDYMGRCDTIDGSAGQATRIATATGGAHVFGIVPATLVPTIAALVEAQVKIINNLSLVPTGAIVPFVTSLEPAAGYGPIDTSTENILTFEVTFTGIPCEDEDITYEGTIDVVADGSLEAAKTVAITVPRCLITVGIDIKPGSYPNSINPSLKGLIPVAILGSADFDVFQVDLHSLTFAGLPVSVRAKGMLQCGYEDVSGDFLYPQGAPDGYMDLVCHFVMDPAKWTPDDGYATLTGLLMDGTPIQGTDSINIVP